MTKKINNIGLHILSLIIGTCVNCKPINKPLLSESAHPNEKLADLKKSIKASAFPIILNNVSKEDINLSYFDSFSDLIPIKINPQQSFTINSVDPIWVINTHFEHGTVYLLKPGDSLSASFDKQNDIKLTPYNNSGREKEIDIFRYINSKFDKSYYQIIYDNTTSNKSEEFFFQRERLLRDRLSKGLIYLEQYISENKLGAEIERYAKNVIKLEYYSKTLLGLWSYKSLKSIAEKNKKTFDSTYLELQNDSLDSTGSPILYRNIKYSYFIRHVQFEIGQDPFEKSEYQRPLADTLYSFALREINNKTRLNNFLFLIIKDELLKYPQSTQNCLLLFFNDCKNDTYKKYIREMLEINQGTRKDNSEDVFLNSAKQETSFSKVINSLKGNIVYIDIWASWCVPCREELPFSIKLRQDYTNKAIVFLYIAIDNNFILWNKAIRQEKLFDYSQSYLLLGFENSFFRERFKIGPIPRYIIIDRSGNIVDANAPRPSENSLIKELDKLLK